MRAAQPLPDAQVARSDRLDHDPIKLNLIMV